MTYLEQILSFIDLEKKVGLSELTLGLIASGLGAAFGAWGAQVIISREQSHKSVIEELNAVSGALMLCFHICNVFVGLKKQHIKPVYDDYQRTQAAHEAFRIHAAAVRAQSGPPQLFQYNANLRTLSPVKVPVETLEKYIFEKIAIRGRGLMAGTSLIGAIDTLDHITKMRNELVNEFRKLTSDDDKVDKYLGLVRAADGGADETFPDNVTALYQLTDDCIFFSKLLGEELLVYGKAKRKKLRFRFWRLPKLSEANWSSAAEFLPPDELYKDWLKGFPRRKSRWERFKAWLKKFFCTNY